MALIVEEVSYSSASARLAVTTVVRIHAGSLRSRAAAVGQARQREEMEKLLPIGH
jgi:hypothetical protein